MEHIVAFAVLGIGAGLLTTVAGLGGGILMLLAVSLATDPKVALVATAPALLAGNLHRAFLFRGDVDRRVARAFALGAFPGSVLGGALLSRMPGRLVGIVMAAMTAVALLRVCKVVTFTPRARGITPVGFGIGALAGTSGGAGMLAGPFLMALGLGGASYVATAAVASVAMHLGRVLSYGLSGLLDASTVRLSLLLLGAVLVGNSAGKWARRFIGPRLGTRIEVTTLVVASALGVFGLTR
ncbi:MAG: sulfite exporter TauE/SafE family protein [Myxococcales bacterium]|nr:sulfite exporter TauE/SafE family protein [Myxococcales bacterium]